MSVPLEVVISIVVGIFVSTAGIIYGITSRSATLRTMGSIDVLCERFKSVIEMCSEFKEFQIESRTDRSNLHEIAGRVGVELGRFSERQQAMATQLDYVYRKVYNGGG